MQVNQLLKTDFENRTKNVDSLYTLDDIDYTNQWDFSVPTLCKHSDFKNNKRMLELKNKEFQDLFFSKIPILRNLDWTGMAICGGSIGSLLFQNDINDIDIFFYGLTPSEAESKLRYFLYYLTESICMNLNNKQKEENKKKNRDSDEPKIFTEADLNIRYVRNKYALTLVCETNYGFPKIQFIFRCYKSLGEILHGFDIGSSALGFDGKRVYFTELSKFSYENSVNIIDTTRRSATYEKRLLKYMDRGFDIVMPNFDISKLSDRRILEYGFSEEYCEMPQLVFGYSRVVGNQIVVGTIYKPKVSYYDDGDDGEYSPDSIDRYKAFHQNLLFLLDKNYNAMFHISNRVAKVFKNEPAIGPKTITLWYNNGRRNCFNGRKLNVNFLKKFITIEKFEIILNKIATLNEQDLSTYLDDLFEKQKEHTMNLLKEAKQLSGAIEWITENPGSQTVLTSSINPVFEEPSAWYGTYFTTDFFNGRIIDIPSFEIVKKE